MMTISLSPTRAARWPRRLQAHLATLTLALLGTSVSWADAMPAGRLTATASAWVGPSLNADSGSAEAGPLRMLARPPGPNLLLAAAAAEAGASGAGGSSAPRAAEPAHGAAAQAAALAHVQTLARRQVVKGAPYCADALSESIQTLADGNRIVRRSTMRLCRDADGRTRQEVEGAQGKRVYLVDPVAGSSWVLMPERKLATRVALGAVAATGAGDAAAWRDYAQRMREWARQHARRPASAPAESGSVARPEPVIISEVLTESRSATAESGAAAASDARREPPRRELRVNVIRLGGDAQGLDAGVPPAVLSLPGPGAASAWMIDAARGAGGRGPGVVTALGSKEFDTADGGAKLRADGRLTTWTIEAGKLGNERPIVITREVWTAAELQLTLSVREIDPRVGETHYRLTQIQRGAPPAELFRPPEGYTLREWPPLPQPPALPPATAPAPPSPTQRG